MQSIKQFASWFATNSIFGAAAYFGCIEGNENAKNVLLFLVFFVTLPLAFIVLTDKFVERAAKSEGRDLSQPLKFISRLVGFFVLGCLAWSGSFVSAAVWVFWMLARLSASERIKNFKQDSEKSA